MPQREVVAFITRVKRDETLCPAASRRACIGAEPPGVGAVSGAVSPIVAIVHQAPEREPDAEERKGRRDVERPTPPT